MADLPHPNLLRRVERTNRRLGSGDRLLIYGLGLPLLLVVAWVGALAVARTPWLVVPVAVLVSAVVLASSGGRAARNVPGPRRRPPA